MRLSTGVSNGFFPRKMNFLTVNMLNYNIYTNPARTTVWGDGTGGTAIRTDSYAMGAGVIARNYDVYFRIPASQSVAAGAYADTINVTLMF
jgi:spore coat protein U-like protein